MIEIDWQAVADFKATDEYQKLGVIGRERLLHETFPEVAERERALTERDIERRVWGIDPPATADPDEQ